MRRGRGSALSRDKSGGIRKRHICLAATQNFHGEEGEGGIIAASHRPIAAVARLTTNRQPEAMGRFFLVVALSAGR